MARSDIQYIIKRKSNSTFAPATYIQEGYIIGTDGWTAQKLTNDISSSLHFDTMLEAEVFRKVDSNMAIDEYNNFETIQVSASHFMSPVLPVNISVTPLQTPWLI